MPHLQEVYVDVAEWLHFVIRNEKRYLNFDKLVDERKSYFDTHQLEAPENPLLLYLKKYNDHCKEASNEYIQFKSESF